jgi:hypothetical protein
MRVRRLAVTLMARMTRATVRDAVSSQDDDLDDLED